jgi:hypothetical protein
VKNQNRSEKMRREEKNTEFGGKGKIYRSTGEERETVISRRGSFKPTQHTRRDRDITTV